MGSILSSSGAAASYYTYRRMKRKLYPIDMEEVKYIEERCVHLSDYTNLITGRHSYLIVTTSTGRQVRYDYNTSSAEPFIQYDYWEILPTSMFRKHLVRPGLSVAQATHIIRKHAIKSDYSLFKHNCQHVSRDAYNEITGKTEVMLRDDFIHMIMEVFPINLRDQIRRKQTFRSQRLKKKHRKLRENLASSPDKDEALDKMNLFFSIGHSKKLYNLFKDYNYLDNLAIDPEYKQPLQLMFGKTGVIYR